MSNYRLWNPSLVGADPPVVELFVTWREEHYIGDGTDEFARELLRDAGVTDEPLDWTLTCCRSPYFSPGPDCSDWEDRWRLAWKLRATLSRLPDGRLGSDLGCTETDACDASYRREQHASPTTSRCLIIADFRDQAARERARAAITPLVAGTFAEATALRRYPQLHVDLGERDGRFYESGAHEAIAIDELCRRHGGSTHHEETWAWSAIDANPRG